MKNQVLRYVAIALLSFGSLVAGWVLAVGVAVNPGGITFPDGTVQTTATFNEVNTRFLEKGELTIGPGDLAVWQKMEDFDIAHGSVGVIEHMSVHCSTPVENPIVYTAVVIYGSGADDFFSFHIPLYYKGDVGATAIYDGGLTSRLYVDDYPGNDPNVTTMNLKLARASSTGSTTCEFALSGHFRPLDV